jgi:translation initiation factor 1
VRPAAAIRADLLHPVRPAAAIGPDRLRPRCDRLQRSGRARYHAPCVTRKKQDPPGRDRPDGSSALSSNPFAGLAGLRDRLPPGEQPKAPPPAAEPAPPKGPARAVVRYERKGRGGKEVTVVEQLGLARADLESWCRELKRALGCGGAVEDTAIALAGDQRTRLPGLLEARGVRRVTVS